MDHISVSDFINTKYRDYWEYSNKNGKNSVDAREQLPEVIRKIIYAAYQLKIRENDEHKTTELMGETGKYHAHGPSSIEDSIKGVATAYKSQPAVRILEGVGNFGSAPGDEGAAGRYTSISGTPLLTSIYKDIPFVPFNTDDTGLKQPEYISMPLPISLITGISAIGTGKSCYIAERDAREIMDWISNMVDANWDENANIEEPAPTSVTGCDTWFNNENGYIYYEAVVHYGVSMYDLSKKGRYDVITALPPKSTPMNVLTKLINKMPTRVSNKIIDGSGKGKPIWIVLPTGYLDEKDFNKYGMRYARKEQIFVWDHERNTMKESDIRTIAKEWMDDRCKIVSKRLNSQIDDLHAKIHRIDLIKMYVEENMTTWKSEDIYAYFNNKFPETGDEDASMVLDAPARWFLPENVGKNEITRVKYSEEIEEIQSKIENIEHEVIQEAYDIIDAQEKFFADR